MSLVLGLGLEHSCPWPRECLSSERLSSALASDFFCVLGLGLGFFLCSWPWPRIFFVSLALASSLVSSTPPLLCTRQFFVQWQLLRGSDTQKCIFYNLTPNEGHSTVLAFQKFTTAKRIGLAILCFGVECFIFAPFSSASNFFLE